jgi:hypothetical protein
MDKTQKIPIFFSFSFEKTPPAWSQVSDLEVAQWFEKLLRNRDFRVLSGRKVESRPIADKVFEVVGQTRAVVALFAGKYQIDSTASRFLPSQWVLCECAYAQGRFPGPEYIIAGFREKGVSINDLASITSKNMQIPEFERDHLDRDKEMFVQYLKDLEQRLLYGPTGQRSIISQRLPYAQTRLRKIVLIYRNGYCTTQNINDLTIKEPDQFSSEERGQVLHHMFNYRTKFPPLETMMQNPIYRRKQAPFFYAKTDKQGNKKLDTPLRVDVDRHDGKDLYFFATFLDENHHPLKLKHNDTIRYQYAWGLPDVFPTDEEGLKAVNGNDIDDQTYCLVEAESNRGPIDEIDLELRFERQSRGGERGELFSKNPIFQTGRVAGLRGLWTTPQTLPKVLDAPPELDMWYEIYRLQIPNFDGRIRVSWRPSSRKYTL